MSGPRSLRVLAVMLVLAAVAAGVQLLHLTTPTRSVGSMGIDVEPLAVEGLPSCERLVGDDASQDQEQEARSETRFSGRVSSAQLYECPGAFDGLRVTYVGEVIGEVLHRDGGSWALVNDDDYALETGPLPAHRRFQGVNSGVTVWLPDDLGPSLTAGGPGVRGDVVEIVGAVERADARDGGGLTLRAGSIEVLAQARGLAPPLHRVQAVMAAVLGVVALAGLVDRRRRNRER